MLTSKDFSSLDLYNIYLGITGQNLTLTGKDFSSLDLYNLYLGAISGGGGGGGDEIGSAVVPITLAQFGTDYFIRWGAVNNLIGTIFSALSTDGNIEYSEFTKDIFSIRFFYSVQGALQDESISSRTINSSYYTFSGNGMETSLSLPTNVQQPRVTVFGELNGIVAGDKISANFSYSGADALSLVLNSGYAIINFKNN